MNVISNKIKEKNDNLNIEFEKLSKEFNREELNFVFYNDKKYIHKDIEESVKRKYQDKFRQGVIKTYHTCVISDVNKTVCQAAHIIPYKDCFNTFKAFEISNGLLLRNDLHTSYDNGDFKINPDTLKIEFKSNILEDDSYAELTKYEGQCLEDKITNLATIKLLRDVY